MQQPNAAILHPSGQRGKQHISTYVSETRLDPRYTGWEGIDPSQQLPVLLLCLFRGRQALTPPLIGIMTVTALRDWWGTRRLNSPSWATLQADSVGGRSPAVLESSCAPDSSSNTQGGGTTGPGFIGDTSGRSLGDSSSAPTSAKSAPSAPGNGGGNSGDAGTSNRHSRFHSSGERDAGGDVGGASAPVERWSDERIHVTVREHPGQLLQVTGAARVPLSFEQVFALITHPANERIFRHLDKCDSREVLEAGGSTGLTVVESEHLASWRFLVFSGTVRTRLRVEQRPSEGQVDFSLVPSGSKFELMRRFSGTWRIDRTACSRQAAGHGAQQVQQPVLLTLQQEAQPAVYLPPPLGRLFKSIACRQLAGIFEDILVEAQRIQQGRPTLWPAQAGAWEWVGSS